ncbi:membrane protein [Brevibacterium yomogidense]|uniref:Membrane protein n=2 Tax=Brevibacteriaceae TaxID=85019 RepID=A0A1X6XIA9_9MICO|nr:DUF485 domain-containing protein [Brevibacterium yomogidense]SLM99014.1 membrane protein [Brevibacterium yomogidense]
MSYDGSAQNSAPHEDGPPESQEPHDQQQSQEAREAREAQEAHDQHDPHVQTMDYIAAQESEEFVALKRSHRSFVFPMAAFFIIWYAVYVLLGAYAHDFMAQPVFGSVNLGIVLGLGQFVTTFLITSIYVMYANRKLDPKAQALRTEFEAQEASS